MQNLHRIITEVRPNVEEWPSRSIRPNIRSMFGRCSASTELRCTSTSDVAVIWTVGDYVNLSSVRAVLFHDTSPYLGDNFLVILERVASVCNNGDVKN